jgi:hypothetical protein
LRQKKTLRICPNGIFDGSKRTSTNYALSFLLLIVVGGVAVLTQSCLTILHCLANGIPGTSRMRT